MNGKNGPMAGASVKRTISQTMMKCGQLTLANSYATVCQEKKTG